MARPVGAILLLISVAVIFLIALRYPFTGTVVLEFSEFWLWFVLVAMVFVAGIGGYLAFRRRVPIRYD